MKKFSKVLMLLAIILFGVSLYTVNIMEPAGVSVAAWISLVFQVICITCGSLLILMADR